MKTLSAVLVISSILISRGEAGAQYARTLMTSPATGALAYDAVRDRIVMPSNLGTFEFDGAVWSLSLLGGGAVLAFDAVRARCVTLGIFVTGEWDGAAWTYVNTAPPVSPSSWETRLCFHKGRGKVVALVPIYSPFPTERLIPYEWDGVSWTPFLGTAPWVSPLNVTVVGPPHGTYSYNSLIYDERRDKLVVFGRTNVNYNLPFDPITWEWDATNGWVQYPASGPAQYSLVWYDAHRGLVVRVPYSSTFANAYFWDPVLGWTPMGSNLPQSQFGASAYDSLRSRYYYFADYNTTPVTMAYVHDTNPAEFMPHGSACASSSAPTLRLTQSWTRAWLGDTMELTAGSLPVSTAVLIMGFSDQTSGGSPLPLDLTTYGMPGCHLRVAPAATLLGVGGNGEANFAVPIPNGVSLVGVNFWQQVAAPVPGANAAGMLLSASYRGSVGRPF